jgi:hypothetical protein
MIRLFLLLFFSLTIITSIAQTIQKDGAVKFIFNDIKKTNDFYFNCTITYDITQKANYFVIGNGDDPILKIKPGIHTFYVKMVLRDKEYKEVIISDVEVWSDKFTYVFIEVIPKKQKNENDTIKIKWQKPKIDATIPQQ